MDIFHIYHPSKVNSFSLPYINYLFKVQNLFLPNKSMQIVFSKIFFTAVHIPIKAYVIMNNQNNGDLMTYESFISSSELIPRIIDSKHTNKYMIIEFEINTDRRHLYLSVTAPIIGVIICSGIGCSMNISPIINAE